MATPLRKDIGVSKEDVLIVTAADNEECALTEPRQGLAWTRRGTAVERQGRAILP